MSEPSEGMQELVSKYALSVVFSATNDGLGSREVGDSRRDLLTAIAELEQRAEKWKRVAVAIKMCGRARDNKYYTDHSCGWLLSNRIDALEKADSELIEAIADLGDEWTEAIR